MCVCKKIPNCWTGAMSHKGEVHPLDLLEALMDKSRESMHEGWKEVWYNCKKCKKEYKLTEDTGYHYPTYSFVETTTTHLAEGTEIKPTPKTEIYTYGLPDRSFRNKRFYFLIDNQKISIPCENTDKNTTKKPLFAEQAVWVQEFEKEGCFYEGDCQWKLKDETLAEKIITLLRSVEEFKGVYENTDYHRNDTIRKQDLLTIDNSTKIEKVTYREFLYNPYGELLEENTILYDVENQHYEDKTGLLTLLAKRNDDLIGRMRFFVNLLDYKFEKSVS